MTPGSALREDRQLSGVGDGDFLNNAFVDCGIQESRLRGIQEFGANVLRDDDPIAAMPAEQVQPADVAEVDEDARVRDYRRMLPLQ